MTITRQIWMLATGGPISAADIIREVIPGELTSIASTWLSGMAKRGLLRRVARGRYIAAKEPKDRPERR